MPGARDGPVGLCEPPPHPRAIVALTRSARVAAMLNRRGAMSPGCMRAACVVCIRVGSFDIRLDCSVEGVTNSGRTVDEISTNRVYRFAGFTLDSGRATLFRGRDEVPLRQRTFDVL